MSLYIIGRPIKFYIRDNARTLTFSSDVMTYIASPFKFIVCYKEKILTFPLRL